MTRRDRCHVIGKHGRRLKPATAAIAWGILMDDLEERLSTADVPKFEQLLNSIRAAHLAATKQRIEERSKHLADNDFLSDWRNVNVSMPDAELTVLVACPDGAEPVWFGYHDGDCWRCVMGERINVTHWQPLPEPPSPPVNG